MTLGKRQTPISTTDPDLWVKMKRSSLLEV